MPPGSGIDLGRVVQGHPAELMLRRQVAGEEAVDGIEILLILLKTVEDIAVPPLRGDGQAAVAAAGAELFVEVLRVAAHDLVAAHKQQGGGHSGKIGEHGRYQGIPAVVGVAGSEEVQRPPGHGGIHILVGGIGAAGGGQVRPGGDGDDTARLLQPQLPQLQAQGIAQSAAGTFAAEDDAAAGIAFAEQVAVALQGILQGGGIGMLRGQPVGGAEYPHTALDRQHGAEALGIVQAAAGVTAAVKVQDHSLPPFILWQHPGSPKIVEQVLLCQRLAAVAGLHELADLILPLPGGFQGTALQQGAQQSQPGAY